VDRFDELVAEGDAVPVDGWDFSWFDGRATEERPPWGYLRMVSERMASVRSALDVQTGGGEVLAEIPVKPPVLAAVDGWPPNLPIARDNLPGALVVRAAEDGPLPFRDGAFDLVVSRHPVVTAWSETARVLRRGGTFLSQQIGAGTNRELTEFFLGPMPVGAARSVDTAVVRAEAAGMDVVDLRPATLTVTFDDVGAVVHFLRKVIWTVPDFTVERYRDRLRDMHRHITAHGSFVSHAQRFLIEARRR
jgi:SAM-dependent methyltransferase